MSKAEETMKNRLKNILKGQATCVLEDNTITVAEKQEQLMVIEKLMEVLNKDKILDDMGMTEYSNKYVKVNMKIQNKGVKNGQIR